MITLTIILLLVFVGASIPRTAAHTGRGFDSLHIHALSDSLSHIFLNVFAKPR